MTRKLLSILLALSLCLTLLPTAAFAADEDGTDGLTVQEQQAEPEVPEEPETTGAPDEEESESENAPDETEPDGAATAVQALIDALPDADALDGMDADARDAAYADAQAAYEAYEVLTAEQQAQLTGADRFEALFGWFNAQVAPLADPVEIYTDEVDANGKMARSTGFSRKGPELTAADTNLSGKYYIVQSNMTINGDLTVDGSKDGGLVLCQNVTLTINGALIHTGGNSFYIYGQSSSSGADTGELIINNSNGKGAAIRSTSTSAPRLGINSGEVTIIGNGSDNLVDKVELYSTKPVHEGILDGEVVLPSEWGKSSVSGKTLVIEYCDHDEEYVTYTPYGTAQHYMTCTQCGFNVDDSSRKYADCGSDGYLRQESINNTQHRKVCPCGNKFGDAENHKLETLPTEDGKHHTTMCRPCGYTPEDGKEKAHTNWNEYGACVDCKFQPFLKGGKDSALYDNLYEALENDETELTLVSYATGANYTGIVASALEFNTGAAITLNMGGYKLATDGTPLTVSKGTLAVKGDAVISQTAKSAEKVAPAIKVTGGELIFEDTLTVTGSANGSAAAPAIEVTGGTVTFRKDVTATAAENPGQDAAIAPAIKVIGGKATFNGKVTAKGGLSAYGGHSRQAAAIYAEGGTLDFQGDLDLNGGLTIMGSAKLENGLTRGEFYATGTYDAASDLVNQKVHSVSRVSVVGSTYENIKSLLGTNRAFADKDTTTINVSAMLGSQKSWTGDVTIVEHEHFYDPADNYTCACGEACTHPEYVNGECKVCHKPCPHEVADQSSADHHYYCNDCHKQMFARIKTGEYSYANYTNLVDAFGAATNGQTVTLLDDIDNSDKRACVIGDGKIVTLDLHGHTIKEGWIQVGYENWNDQTSSTLKIVDNGSFINTGTYGNLSVGYKATLDLSGWTSGTITRVQPSKSGDSESKLTVEADENKMGGTINRLAFSSWPSNKINNTKLTCGTYDLIEITMNDGVDNIAFSDLLAEGYAFRYTKRSGYVNYDTKAFYTGGGRISDVEVVLCPHDDVENDACLYCGQTGIRAKVGETPYADVGTAVADWLANGGTLKLFDNYKDTEGGSLDLSKAKAALAIDLNGHSFYEDCAATTLDGQYLTITDTKGTGVFGPVEAKSGILTLERGTLQKLTVSDNSTANISINGGILQELTIDTSTATISLKGGQVNCISSTLPVYKLLPNGLALMKGGNPVDPTEILYPAVEAAYTVKDPYNITPQEGRKATISYGQNTLPFELTLTTGDSDVKLVKFTWYQVNVDGAVTELASTGNIAPNEDGYYTYDTTATGTDALSILTPGEYKAICVISGLNGDGICLWKTALGNRDLIVEKANLSNAEIQFVGGNSTVFNPSSATTVPVYIVKCNGKDLNGGGENRDYIVRDGDTASAVGDHYLTIKADPDSPYYTGSKTAQWTVTQHTLSIPTPSPSTITKQYDGTTALPNDNITFDFSSREPNPSTERIPLTLGTDYTVSGAHYADANVGQGKKIFYTIKLLNQNYRFSNGGDELESDNTADGYEITKADAPAVTKTGTLEVVNNHAASYTFDLSTLLPELERPKTYGDVTYSLPAVNLRTGYFTVGENNAKVENGKLILTINKNNVTTTGSIGTVTVTVTTQNYKDFTLTVNVSATNKIVPTGAPTLSKTTLTYGEPLSAVTLSGTMQNGDAVVEGTFAWTAPETVPNAGTYQAKWIFTPKNTGAYLSVDGTATITVEKATPTGNPKYTAITSSGKTLADAALTTEGGTFSVSGTVQWVDAEGNALDARTEVKANTAYQWRFTPTDADNYNVLEGSITLYTVSTGGGGGSTVTTPTTTETETTTDPDGTTTKTETKSDGSTVETVTKPDGSTTTTETKTETKPDGSTTTTETKSETNADGSKTETKSETTTNADGSKTETKSETKTEADGTKSESETKTETKPDGSTVETKSETSTAADGSKTESKTETTTAADGSKTETKSETKTEAGGTKSETKAETKTDANGVTSGTETTKTTAPDGSTGTTITTTENGNTKTEAEAKISEKAVEDAKQSGEAVKVPTEVKAGEDSNSAPTVKVELPKDAGETKIEIPVSDVNSGTVAVIVHEDGTEEIVKSSTTTENGLQLKVEGSATIKVVDNSKTFDDTQKHWSRDEVNFVASRELFNGVGGSSFGVNEPMTRGMVNTVLARLAGVDTTPKDGQKWYEVGTEWAKANGITDGTNPEASVTREQLAAMLYRYAGSSAVNGELSFADVDHVSGYAKDALLWAVQNGIMNGVDNEHIAPRAEAQRAQVAAMMARYLKNVG